jgi:hypothetical protein
MWRQQSDAQLFPDVQWKRPEQRAQAKKLLIVGGHTEGFDQIARAYQAATAAGIGEARMAVPRSLKPVLANAPGAAFLSATPAGEIALAGADELVQLADLSDGALCLQVGANSETTRLLTTLARRSTRALIIGDEALHLLRHDLDTLLPRASLMLVVSFGGLQELARIIHPKLGLRHDMGVRPLALALESLNLTFPLVTELDQQILVVYGDQVISTKRPKQIDMAMLAAWCATWWLQIPDQPLEALAAASFEF